MSTYIPLLKLTEQGIRNIKEIPEGVEQAIKAMDARRISNGADARVKKL